MHRQIPTPEQRDALQQRAVKLANDYLAAIHEEQPEHRVLSAAYNAELALDRYRLAALAIRRQNPPHKAAAVLSPAATPKRAGEEAGSSDFTGDRGRSPSQTTP